MSVTRTLMVNDANFAKPTVVLSPANPAELIYRAASAGAHSLAFEPHDSIAEQCLPMPTDAQVTAFNAACEVIVIVFSSCSLKQRFQKCEISKTNIIAHGLSLRGFCPVKHREDTGTEIEATTKHIIDHMRYLDRLGIVFYVMHSYEHNRAHFFPLPKALFSL